jgi:PAS domain S-box-containing protein
MSAEVDAPTPEPTASVARTASPAVIVTDVSGAVLHWSPAAEELYGWAVGEALGGDVGHMAGPVDPATVQARTANLAMGVSWEGRFRTRTRDGATLEVSSVDAPLIAVDGRVVGVVSLSVPTIDALGVPEQERVDAAEWLARMARGRADAATERLVRLQRIAGALSKLLSPSELAEVIVNEVGPELGGASRGLWLVNEVGSSLELVLPDRHPRAEPFTDIPVGGDLPGALVVRSGEALFITTRVELERRFPMLVDVGPQMSIAVLPLIAGDRVTGVLAISYDDDHSFPPDERRFLGAVADLASQSLERSRLHIHQVEVAQALQRTLLPPQLPVIPGVGLGAVYHPAGQGMEVGGDFYDVFAVGPDRWALMIGDVCGTGPAAAALTAQVRHTAHTALRAGMGLEQALAVVNDELVESIDDERFCTMVLAEIRPDAHGVDIDLVCAGHPSPLVQRATGEIEELASDGMLVGVFAGIVFRARHLRLGSGDAVVLYTDGVPEGRAAGPSDDGRVGFFGPERLVDVLTIEPARTAQALVADIETALMDYSGGRFADDVAILAVRAQPRTVSGPADNSRGRGDQ